MPMARSASSEKSRRQPATGPLDATPIATPIAMPTQRADAGSPQPVQASLTRPAPISQSAPAKRKHSQDSEAEADEPESVRLRLPSPHLELSKRNLRRFNGEEMDSAANKRSSSQRSITASSDVTQRSSHSNTFYRFTHLAAAEIYIHTDPPADIQNAIDVIIKAEPSKERRDELEIISKEFQDNCKQIVKAGASKYDFIRLFTSVLRAMNHNYLCFHTKVGLQEELKPKIQRCDLDLSCLMDSYYMAGNQHQEVDDAPAPPQKRQQQSAGQAFISPREKERDRSPIKTARPDILMGIEHETFLSALSSQNLDNIKARILLAELQDKMVSRESGEPQEPMLISVPASLASDLVYPFAVLEGKAYSTGKQIFEAENQAAVSGACGLKIQFYMDELANHATTNSNISPILSNISPPFFFSICTQGPICELWAHYTHVEYGVRKFNMMLLKVCHGMLLDGVVDFIVAADNMCRWGTGQFMESVVERVGKVGRRASYVDDSITE